MKKENKYFKISFEKERVDNDLLAIRIANDTWFNSSVILVNCMPEYSSRLVHSMNQMFSSYNRRNELLEYVDMQIPYPNSSQVWNPYSKSYENFDTYLKSWINENVFSNNFLFINCATLTGKHFNKIKLSLRNKLENEQFRFASTYLQDDSILTPDFYVEKFNKEQQGGILFAWENPENPNWGY